MPPEIPKEYGEPASGEAPIRAKWMNHGVTDAPLGAEGVPPRSNATHSLERPWESRKEKESWKGALHRTWYRAFCPVR